jgi:hypothetical protein
VATSQRHKFELGSGPPHIPRGAVPVRGVVPGDRHSMRRHKPSLITETSSDVHFAETMSRFLLVPHRDQVLPTIQS